MVEEFALDRIFGLDLYGIPLRPWRLTGHVCPASAVDVVAGDCCAWEVCAPSVAGRGTSEFSAGVSWGEVAEIVELHQHRHEEEVSAEFREIEHHVESGRPPEREFEHRSDNPRLEAEDDEESDDDVDSD